MLQQVASLQVSQSELNLSGVVLSFLYIIYWRSSKKFLKPRECPRGQKPATLQCLNHSEIFHRALHCLLSFGLLLSETNYEPIVKGLTLLWVFQRAAEVVGKPYGFT